MHNVKQLIFAAALLAVSMPTNGQTTRNPLIRYQPVNLIDHSKCDYLIKIKNGVAPASSKPSKIVFCPKVITIYANTTLPCKVEDDYYNQFQVGVYDSSSQIIEKENIKLEYSVPNSYFDAQTPLTIVAPLGNPNKDKWFTFNKIIGRKVGQYEVIATARNITSESPWIHERLEVHVLPGPDTGIRYQAILYVEGGGFAIKPNPITTYPENYLITAVGNIVTLKVTAKKTCRNQESEVVGLPVWWEYESYYGDEKHVWIEPVEATPETIRLHAKEVGKGLLKIGLGAKIHVVNIEVK